MSNDSSSNYKDDSELPLKVIDMIYQPNPEPFSFRSRKKKPKGYQESQSYCKNCKDPFVKLNGRGEYCYDCKDPHTRKKKREEYLREHPEESA